VKGDGKPSPMYHCSIYVDISTQYYILGFVSLMCHQNHVVKNQLRKPNVKSMD
jgi:hypothetical protein